MGSDDVIRERIKYHTELLKVFASITVAFVAALVVAIINENEIGYPKFYLVFFSLLSSMIIFGGFALLNMSKMHDIIEELKSSNI